MRGLVSLVKRLARPILATEAEAKSSTNSAGCQLERPLHLVHAQPEAKLMTMPPSTYDGEPAGEKRTPARVRLDYVVQVDLDAWELPEVPVPESVLHHLVVQYIEALLTAWAARSRQDALIAHNLAVRWIESRPGLASIQICV